MNNIKFNLTASDGSKKTFICNTENSAFTINDEVVREACEKVNIQELKHLQVTLGVHDMFLDISSYTLTDTLYINAFYNVRSHIKILKVIDTNIHMTEQNISHFQADCKSILMSDCSVEKFDIGLCKWHNAATERGKCLYEVENFDIRNCYIKRLNVFAQCKKINIQESTVEEINDRYITVSEEKTQVSTFHIWQNTNIKKLTLSDDKLKFKIDNSTIETILARSNLFVKELEVNNSIIINSYGFDTKNFKIQTLDSWQIIEKSAHNSNNLKLRSEALYNIVNLSSQGGKVLERFVRKMFDFCAGYGYKPIRLLRASGLVILINAIIFSIIQFIFTLTNSASIAININNLKNGFLCIINNIFISFSAFAGQSGLTRTDGVIFWFGTVEYIIGIVFFAMFVNALYLRYKE